MITLYGLAALFALLGFMTLSQLRGSARGERGGIVVSSIGFFAVAAIAAGAARLL